MATEYKLRPDIPHDVLISRLPEGVQVINAERSTIEGHGGQLSVFKDGEYRLSRTGAANNADALVQALADALKVEIFCYLNVEHFKPTVVKPAPLEEPQLVGGFWTRPEGYAFPSCGGCGHIYYQMKPQPYTAGQTAPRGGLCQWCIAESSGE